jgi:hypothetical protein
VKIALVLKRIPDGAHKFAKLLIVETMTYQPCPDGCLPAP